MLEPGMVVRINGHLATVTSVYSKDPNWIWVRYGSAPVPVRARQDMCHLVSIDPGVKSSPEDPVPPWGTDVN